MRIFTIGETTYDIFFRDRHPDGACSGGSAFNSAISLGRCGLPVSLISTFGNDPIGDISFEILNENGVNCDLVKRFNGQSRIALAFLDSGNNASYSFYQASKDVFPDYPEPKKNDIILLGSSFAIRTSGRENLLNFLIQANHAGSIVIYDPNSRQPIAGNGEIKNRILENIGLATIIKGSDEDFRNIFNHNDGSSVFSIVSEIKNKYLIYTKGANGAELFTPDFHLTFAAKETNVVSTIGAGDNFSAGIVFGIFNYLIDGLLIEELTMNKWSTIMNWGILFASEVCGSSENYLPVNAAKRFLSGQIQMN